MNCPSNATVWIGAGWKMNKTIAEACEYVDRLVVEAVPAGVQAFICPPHTALAAVRDRLPPGSPILLGAQNAHWADEGAGTGEISMRMIKDAGAALVELGHSERREHFRETDHTVALKVRSALDHELIPLICIGESASVRDAGGAEEFVLHQLRAATAALDPEEIGRLLVAYEPVWAIGVRGRPATPGEVAPSVAALAAEIVKLSGGTGCRGLLYGGGVDLDNAAAMLSGTRADGLFVGRAAWNVDGLVALLAIGSLYAATRGY